MLSARQNRRWNERVRIRMMGLILSSFSLSNFPEVKCHTLIVLMDCLDLKQTDFRSAWMRTWELQQNSKQKCVRHNTHLMQGQRRHSGVTSVSCQCSRKISQVCKSTLFAQMLTNAAKVIRWHFTVQPRSNPRISQFFRSQQIHSTHICRSMQRRYCSVITQRVKGWPTR